MVLFSECFKAGAISYYAGGNINFPEVPLHLETVVESASGHAWNIWEINVITWWQLEDVLCSTWTLGKISNLTSIFQMGWNHQPDDKLKTALYNTKNWDVTYDIPVYVSTMYSIFTIPPRRWFPSNRFPLNHDCARKGKGVRLIGLAFFFLRGGGWNNQLLWMQKSSDHHLGCKQWDELPTSTGDSWISEPSTVFMGIIISHYKDPIMNQSVWWNVIDGANSHTLVCGNTRVKVVPPQGKLSIGWWK